MTFRTAFLLVLLTALPASAQNAKDAERAAMNRLKGQQSAAVTVYEIADFQCPYCAKFSREVFPQIDSAYVKTGKAKWIFVNFPLPTHSHAWAAAEAAMCAGTSDKFWPMHDRIFANQAEWSDAANPAALFSKYARESGVTKESYDACVASDGVAAILIRDLLNASGAGITGTPAFVINNDPIFAGYKTFDEWREILDTAYRKATAPPK